MQKTALRFTKTGTALGVPELDRYAEGWLLDCEIRQHSKATLAIRRLLIDKLLWFLRDREYTECGTLGLRQFFAYVTNGHANKAGRWDNPQLTKPVRPRTVHTYHGHLRTFFRWLIQEGAAEASPWVSRKRAHGSCCTGFAMS